MSRLSDAELFVSLVEEGGFSAAARRRGLTQSAVSRRIAALEARLGARLVARTTRRFALTDAGRAYLDGCRRVLAGLDETEREVAAASDQLRGRVRATLASAFGRRCVVPHLPAFFARHPEIRLELAFQDRFVDLVEEGFDLAVRLRDPGTPGLVARRLATTRLVACAAPAYLARAGAPRTPAELVRHDALVLAVYAPRDRWRFTGREGETSVRVTARVQADDAEALRLAALSGLGVALLPDYLVGDDLASGALVDVLPRHRAGSLGVFAVHPTRRQMPRRVRVFVDFLAEALAGRR